METESTQKSPYRGMWVVSLILIAVPAVVFAIVWAVYTSDKVGRSREEAYVTAVVVSGLIGVIFDLMCAICGSFKDSFSVVKNRVKDFASDLSISPKMAFGCYFDNMKTDGVVFLIYFVELAATVGWLAYGIKILVAFLAANGGF